MPLSSRISDDGKTVTISVSGRFDFHLHQDFRQAMEHGDARVTNYIIDMSRTEYMDSSALGMLLLLRERAGENGPRVRIVHAAPEVRKVLEVANFDKLFSLE